MLAARKLASDRQHNHVSNLHVMLAMAESEPDAFSRLGIDADAIKTAAENGLKLKTIANAGSTIKRATEIAMNLKTHEITNSHILAGMLTQPDESIVNLFSEVDVQLSELRELVIAQIRS